MKDFRGKKKTNENKSLIKKTELIESQSCHNNFHSCIKQISSFNVLFDYITDGALVVSKNCSTTILGFYL